MHSPEREVIAKPSEVLSGVRAMMDVLQTLESYIHIDVSRIFNTVLLQQTQPIDGLSGQETITQVRWLWTLYIETLYIETSSFKLYLITTNTVTIQMGTLSIQGRTTLH